MFLPTTMREGREDGNSRPGYRKRGSKRKGLGMERKLFAQRTRQLINI